MALNKPALKQGIKQLLDDMQKREQNSNDEFAERLSTLFETFVKSGTVTVQPGIVLATTGMYASPGTTTGTGNGTIN